MENSAKLHLDLQESYFKRLAGVFTQPIPEEISQRLKEIVQTAELKSDARVLDVGTGTGVLIYHFLEQNVAASNIVGCDLCPAMLDKARARFPQITFWQGDFNEFPLDFGKFDALFVNGCFGNFYNQTAVIGKAQKLLATGGKLVISHPLGAKFVEGLHQIEPDIVPHLLPDKSTLLQLCEAHNMSLKLFLSQPRLYLAILTAS